MTPPVKKLKKFFLKKKKQNKKNENCVSRKVYYVLVDPGIDSLYISVYNNEKRGMIHQDMATAWTRGGQLNHNSPVSFRDDVHKRRKNLLFSFLIDYVRSLKSV